MSFIYKIFAMPFLEKPLYILVVFLGYGGVFVDFHFICALVFGNLCIFTP